jgi:hypothetical protein
LTKDICSVRYGAALIAGVDAAELRVEWPQPELPGTRGSRHRIDRCSRIA